MALNFLDPADAEVFINEVFAGEPQRLRHLLVIAELVRQSARDINELNPGMNVDEVLAYCAALVHDIGYIDAARQTGFHPLDGYNFLCRHGAPQLARRIAGHSSSPEEAVLLGFTLPEYEEDIVAKLITYWDMQVKQGGEIAGYDERRQDIVQRYGEESVIARAHGLALPRIKQIIEEIDRLLKRIPE